MTAPSAPGRLGRYELVRVLGEGGQGRVYEAVLAGPGGFRRTVALKLMTDGAGLRREARLGGLLRHPHLVDVYEVGEVDGTWFLAMEYCADGALVDRLPLPPRAVVDVGLQVCAALQYAHDELGLVHLDLKPQNLLLDGPIVKVADLGIARGQGVEPRRRVEGTLGYMAPERHQGLADPRTDVYALGVVLSELATGRRPEARSGSETLGLDDLDATPQPATERDPVAWLEPVLVRCLAYRPEDRFGSMAELAAALRGLVVTGPSLADVLGPGRARPDVATAAPQLRLVGRDAELAALATRLERPGLVTLKGPPGIGKTALALAAAERYAARGGVGTWFVDLADAGSPVDVFAAVARALDVPLGKDPDDALLAQVGHALASRGSALLVLDNVERVAAHAWIFGRWAELAPDLCMLATGRAALRVVGEWLLEVGTLAEPDAVALIRACALRRGVELGDDPALVELARRLDGVPLALELAAGRLGVLPLAEVLERLSLSLLRTGRAEASDREATLRGALAWSFELLDPAGRQALAQLSVFRGGFTLEAAEEVLDVPDVALPTEVLEALVDQSLVAVRDRRFALWMGVREFAAEFLSDATSVERRHGRWFARFGSPTAVASLRGHGGAARRVALASELANLEVACRRAVGRDDPAVASATLIAAWEVLEYRGPYRAAVELALPVVAMSSLSTAQRCAVDAVAGRALLLAGRGAEAITRYEEALALATASGDLRGAGVARSALGAVALDHGRADEARGQLEAAIGLFVEVGDRAAEGVALVHLGNAELRQGRLAAAQACYEAARVRNRELGNRRHEALSVENLGIVCLHRGRHDEAQVLFEQALAAYVEIGDRRCECSVRLNLGNLLTNFGDATLAAAQFDAALRSSREVGDRRNEGRVLANFGLLPLFQGRPGEALAAFEAALGIHREVADRFSEGVALCNLGRTHLELGDLPAALSALEEALVVHREVGNRRFEALVGAILAARVASEDPARARELIGRSELLAAQSGGPSDRCSVWIAAAEVAWLRGDHEAADQHLDEARALAADFPVLRWELARALARRPT